MLYFHIVAVLISEQYECGVHSIIKKPKSAEGGREKDREREREISHTTKHYEIFTIMRVLMLGFAEAIV